MAFLCAQPAGTLLRHAAHNRNSSQNRLKQGYFCYNYRTRTVSQAAADDRNAQQLDQLLAGLADLRQQQQLGLRDDEQAGEYDEYEEEEFPPELEGIEWGWWRVDDVTGGAEQAQARTAGADGTAAHASTSGSNLASSDGHHLDRVDPQLDMSATRQQTQKPTAKPKASQGSSQSQQTKSPGPSTAGSSSRVRRRRQQLQP